jgi:hypothetical protein
MRLVESKQKDLGGGLYLKRACRNKGPKNAKILGAMHCICCFYTIYLDYVTFEMNSIVASQTGKVVSNKIYISQLCPKRAYYNFPEDTYTVLFREIVSIHHCSLIENRYN